MKNVAKLMSLLLSCMMLLCACSIENVAYALIIDGEKVPVAEYNYVFESAKAIIEQEIGNESGFVDWENATYDGKNAKEAAYDMTIEQLKQLYAAVDLAKEAGIKADRQCNQYVERVREQLIENAGSEDNYKTYLKDLDSSDQAVKSIYKKMYLLNKLYSTQAESDYEPTEEEIKTYFFENYVKAKHILFKTVDDSYAEVDADTLSVKEYMAKNTLEKIQNGADFDALMRELTEDPGLANSPNGYIFCKNMMDPAFETAAYALNPGEVSDIVKGSYGYHILKRVELTDADYDEYCAEQMQEDVTGADYLKNQLVSNRFQNKLTKTTDAMNVERNEEELAKMVY